MLHRDHSVIVRELQRNVCPDGIYRAHKAHERALKRQDKPRKRKLDDDDVLRNWVAKQLIEGWSPQQIAGRLKNRPDSQVIGSYVCHETIYQYIYEGDGRFMGLYQYLTRKRKKRQRRFGRKSRRNKGILYTTPIAFRPKEIEEKREVGHWESDSMVFLRHKPGLSVQKERLSQLTLIRKLHSMRAEETEDVLRFGIETMPSGAWKSVTFDRGSEGGNHWKLRLDYGIDTYQCDPYCSWQKGGVENTNGLIRRYLPRTTDPTTITNEDVYAVQERLNNRPRKSLGYKTPHEVFRELTGQEVVH